MQETQEMLVRSLGWEDPLQEDMAMRLTCNMLQPEGVGVGVGVASQRLLRLGWFFPRGS